MDDCLINIKLTSNKTLSITVKRTTSIREIKELLNIENEKQSHLNLVFAGQLLKDNMTVEDYNFGGQTTIHAFSVSDKSQGVNRTLETASVVQCNSHFFVYCKICDYVRPGKLRVCCRLCASSLFLVEQGPSSWEDISADSTIRGECKSEGCNGTQPRFYMKCSQFHTFEGREGDGTAVALKHFRANQKQVECIICQEARSPVLVFPCPPGHVMCLECFRQYAVTNLNARQFVEHDIHGYTLPCPSGSCENFHIEDSHHFCLLGINEYERYKNFGAEEYVLQNGGVLCPGPNCGMGMFPEEENSRVQCTECQYVSCKHCKREFHAGTCEDSLQSQLNNTHRVTVDSEAAQRASWEGESLSLIGEISKPCPKCQVKTQRSGGCMHMTCSRCHMDWCWSCVKPWDSQCQENHWFG